ELLVAIGRDENNQMYLIAWAVMKVENNENWCWVLALLHEDLNLQHGNGLTVISDSHKKKLSRVHLAKLFSHAASTTLEQRFYFKIEEIKVVSQEAYEYLIKRNPNSWAILVQRTKPIITMLEDIRLYLMQIFVSMHRIARTWEDTIRPSIIKRIELLKEEQRFWMVIPSGFQELEVRKGHQVYRVNIHLTTCMCRMWQLSGIPCVYLLATYCHMNRDPVEELIIGIANIDFRFM
ncbi:splicing factor, partial [Tanacetum coccineum]